MKLRDYPGTDLPRKELHKRLMTAYQLAGRLLIAPEQDMDPAIRSEMVIVLLDFLSDPTTADLDRLDIAARGFAPQGMVVNPVKWTYTVGGSVTGGTPIVNSGTPAARA